MRLRFSHMYQRLVTLPAGFGDAGQESCGCVFAESDPGKLETAKESTAAAGDLAAVHQTGRAGIAWKHRETYIVFLSLQLVPEVCVFINGLCFALVACDPTFLSHNSGAVS